MTGRAKFDDTKLLGRYKLAQQGDEEALACLVQAHQGLVAHIARCFEGQGLPLEDLVGEGQIGLLNAIRGFDPERGYKFSSYATPAIRRVIERAIRAWNHAPEVREDLNPKDGSPLPDEAATREARVETHIDALRSLSEKELDVLVLRYGLENGRPRTHEEIGRMLGTSREQAWELESAALTKLRGEGYDTD